MPNTTADPADVRRPGPPFPGVVAQRWARPVRRPPLSGPRRVTGPCRCHPRRHPPTSLWDGLNPGAGAGLVSGFGLRLVLDVAETRAGRRTGP